MLCCLTLAAAVGRVQPAAPDPAALARALADSLRPLGVVAVLPGAPGSDTAYPLRTELAAALGVPVAAGGATLPQCPPWGAVGVPRPVYAVSAYLASAPDEGPRRGSALSADGPSALSNGLKATWVYVFVAIRCGGRPGVPRSGYTATWTYALEPAGPGRWRVVRRVGWSSAT